MKQLTLEQTWKYCLSMWRWIAKERKGGSCTSVNNLKEEWLLAHGFEKDEITDNCFFCDYVESHNSLGCNKCPGTQIDPKFECSDDSYDWHSKPIAFYNKLVSLNRKRKMEKK